MLILFGGAYYYPQGGAEDFICSNGELAILEDLGNKLLEDDYLHYSEVDWWHVFDTTKNCIVSEGHRW